MVIGKIKVTGTRAYTIEALDIPQGIVGATVSFDFSEDWAGLTKNVVFIGAKDVEILDIQDSVNLPPEVVAAQNVIVKVGVVGVDANKKMVIPTLWADLGTVKPGAPVDMGYDPTLPIWAQLLGMIGDLRNLNTVDKSSLVAAVNEVMSNSGGGNGAGAGGYYTPVVTQPTANTMKISFVPSVATMPAVEPVTITLPGSDSGQNPTVATVEPAYGDRPIIFFSAPLQQTKDEIICQMWYYSKTLSFTCYVKIKAQGNSTMNFAKKNQSIKMYEDAECTKKLKVDFKGWGKQFKFVLKAYWRDLTHCRDIGSVRLETDCAKSREDYNTMPELLRTSPNLGAVDGFPVVVYAAGVYQGRYMFNIPKDKWAYNMDDELDEHCMLCSENYKSGCFRAAAKIDGSDWTDEIHDTVPASIKTRWNEVISFVMNSTNEEFVANLDSYINVNSLIDRHIMGIYSCDFDGYGKNQGYVTYDGRVWYAVPYDKDGTWGNYWTGNYMLPSNYGREQYEDFTSSASDGSGNLLFIRLEQLFWQRMQNRWNYLKEHELSIPNTIHRLRELYDITPPHVIEEDYASTTANGAFTDIPNKTTCTIQQIQQFAVERHAWTDEYVAALTGESGGGDNGGTEVTLSSISATYSGGDVAVGTAVTDLTGIVVTATYSDGSTATVTDYALSGEIVEGSNTITVSHGGKTTTFAVTGIVPVVDDGIDYSADALAGVAWTNNVDFDSSGNHKTAENHHVTEKFALQNCMHKLVNSGSSTYIELHFWNENDEYVGMWVFSNSFNFVPNVSYKYAIRLFNSNGTDNVGLALKPVDNRRTVGNVCEITPADMAWTKGKLAYECVATDVLAAASITDIATNVKTASDVVYIGVSFNVISANVNKGYIFSLNTWNGTQYLQIAINDASVTDVNSLISYLQTNDVKLILNA